MAPKFTFLSEIRTGRLDWMIKVRVLHLWIVPNQSIEMVLMDQKGVRIHATVRQLHMRAFSDKFKAGMCYMIENLLVAQNDQRFRSTHHKYRLSILKNTTVTDFIDENIPKVDYQFMSFHDVATSGDEKYLIDVIGHVIQRAEIKEIRTEGKPKKILELILEDLEGIRINCTLWNTYAEEMNTYLTDHNEGGPVIIIFQYCRVKSYNGKNSISNSFYGTILLMDPDSKECADYKEKLLMRGDSSTHSVSHVSSQRSIQSSNDILNTNRMTIAEMVESTKEVSGAILGKLIEIESADDWWYHSCITCNKKVKIVGTKFECPQCKKDVMVVPRFRVQVKVIDDTGSASFVIFDRIMKQMIGRSAPDIISSSSKENMLELYPAEFDALIDKTFLFKVVISEVNIQQNYSVYTVQSMSNDDELMQQFRTMHPIKDFSDDDDRSVGNNAPHQDDNLKDFITGNDEATPTSKSLKRKLREDVQECDLSDDGASQMSSTKVLKEIKIEKD